MGVHLSSVQAAAVELILVREERLKSEDFLDRFKLALIANNPKTWIGQMYPDWTRGQATEDEADMDLSDTSGKWVFTDTVTPEDAERAFNELLAERGGSLGADALGDEEGWF